MCEIATIAAAGLEAEGREPITARLVADLFKTGDTLELDHVGLSEASAIHAFLRQACDRLHRVLPTRIEVGKSATGHSTRQDDTLTTSLGVSYGLSRRYTLGLDVAHTQRDSTLAPNNYKRNTVLVCLNAAL